ncbi:SMI1/KNR4 family protein [Amycolatopsis carbonis]|uniref:SMI1/KNR4 family protein n=1 Tax=Amycolatopsis carbonis TaxID=715471 RepID=A0A9Y2IAR0_9PSEU|nr:SMI1/KNR4 family protein [Amycolatopsis sp. 2-15]WIX76114.1 SMI1/KNR4 family protein [Amycolatopsis sp. 2-15]
MTWDGVRGRLAKRRDSRSVFGASAHGFRLAPPLREPEAEGVEEQFGTSLPEPYRSFLVEVGASGAGPGYGLLGFRRSGRRWEFAVGDRRGDGVDSRAEFPHRELFHHAERPDFTTIPRERWPELSRSLDASNEAGTHGTLPLCHRGCGHYDLLVVTGPDRGALWFDCEASDGGIGPRADGRGRMTFDPWYLGWLAEVELQAERARGHQASWWSRR